MPTPSYLRRGRFYAPGTATCGGGCAHGLDRAGGGGGQRRALTGADPQRRKALRMLVRRLGELAVFADDAGPCVYAGRRPRREADPAVVGSRARLAVARFCSEDGEHATENGVFERCARGHGEPVATNGAVQAWKRSVEPTPGFEPETSFLPTISLRAVWHVPGDRERNASNHGVLRFNGTLFPGASPCSRSASASCAVVAESVDQAIDRCGERLATAAPMPPWLPSPWRGA